MTYKFHGFLDNEMVINYRMKHIPRIGDTVRFHDGIYGVVTEVVWCMDEDDQTGQRVNIRIESEAC